MSLFQTIVLERQNKDRTWPRSTTETSYSSTHSSPHTQDSITLTTAGRLAESGRMAKLQKKIEPQCSKLKIFAAFYLHMERLLDCNFDKYIYAHVHVLYNTPILIEFSPCCTIPLVLTNIVPSRTPIHLGSADSTTLVSSL